MTIGYSDLKNVIRLPGTWDAAYLQQWRLMDGTTFDTLVRNLGAALVLFNRGLTEGYWAQYFRSTTDLTLKYGTGTSGRLAKVSEYGRPDPIRGDMTGHMLPLDDYGGALGWTYLALRRAHAGALDEDIRALIQRSQDTWEYLLLTRLFKSAADTVGNTGKSVPFADGGTADADYVPLSFQGKDFLSTHNHFLRYANDANGRSAALEAMAEHLYEHGLMPPYELIIPEADIATWAAQTEFKKPERGLLSTAGVEVRAAVPEETYIGLVELKRAWARVKVTPRLPTAYAGMFKVFGNGDTRSPLAVRYESGYPLGLSLVGEVREFPLQDAIAYFTFGVGVGNRLNGTAVTLAAAGNYVDPTIS